MKGAATQAGYRGRPGPATAPDGAQRGAAAGNSAKIAFTAAKISARGSPSRESVSLAQPRQTTRFVSASSTSITSVPFATERERTPEGPYQPVPIPTPDPT